MKNTSSLLALTLALCLITENANAQTDTLPIDVSANISLTSDYIFRGISQSDENFAIQGGFDLEHDSGLYAGIWASSVDFNDNDQANIEVDLYAGYSGNIDNLSYDIGGLYYAYPGARDSLNYDFWEAYITLGYDFDVASVNVGTNYSPDYFGESGDSLYTHASVDVPLPHNFTFSAGIGYQSIDDNAAFGTPDYTTWNSSLSYDWRDLNFSATYHDTDLSEPNECSDGCDARVVFAISTDFSL